MVQDHDQQVVLVSVFPQEFRISAELAGFQESWESVEQVMEP